MRIITIIILTFTITIITTPTFAQNRVLSLDGDGDYVEMADSENLNAIDSQVTMEAWVKATMFPNRPMPIIYKGEKQSPSKNRSYTLWLERNGRIYLDSAPSDKNERIFCMSSTGSIALNTWYHVTGIIDAKNGVMKILINGAVVSSGDFGKDIRVSVLPLRIGFLHGTEGETWYSPFAGQIDEVRIWNIARTQEEIRSAMHTTLLGKEPGLVGYWQFDTGKGITIDSSPSRSDGKLQGDAHFIEAELPKPGELVIPTVISGRITTQDGKPIQDANVRLEQDGEKITQAQSDAEGNYWLVIPEKEGLQHGLYDLFATRNELGDLRLGIRLRLGLSAKRIETKGESQTMNLTLKEAVCIEGKLMMLDDMTPHVAVVVQAVSDLPKGRQTGGKRIVTVLSDEEGKYSFINLKPGQYQVRCYTTNGYVYYQNGEVLRVQRTSRLSNIDFRMAPFKKGVWRHYTSLDGLPYNAVNCILAEPDGTLLFGTDGGGVSRYDGRKFVSLTDRDGLPRSGAVWGMVREPDGTLWLGPYGEGVVRYDGDEFASFTTKDGLVSDNIVSIYRKPNGEMWVDDHFGEGVSRYAKNNGRLRLTDGTEWVGFATKDGFPAEWLIHHTNDGRMWFRTTSGGICYYDGKQFVRFALEDGLAKHYETLVKSTTSDGRFNFTADGVMWLDTSAGVARYDGQTFSTLTSEDGLPRGQIVAIKRDSDGALWFGMWRGAGGVSRYDGTGFINFTTHDGLLTKAVKDLYWDADGALWVATGSSTGWSTRGGVSRYDDKTFINFTTKDGLASNRVSALDCFVGFDTPSALNPAPRNDPGGSLWIGTVDGGVSHYNGKDFVHLTTEDGLADNRVSAIHRAPSGVLWFGTGGLWAGGNGVSRYNGSVPERMKSESDAPNVEASVNGRRPAFVNLLPGKNMMCIESEPDGTMWFGTFGDGVFRYDFDTQATQSKDEEAFTNFTTEDGLPHNQVLTVCRDPEGMIWFGTMDGLSRYNGQTFVNVNFTPREGYLGNAVKDLYWDTVRQSSKPALEPFTAFEGKLREGTPQKRGLTDGALWLATWGSGIFRYDGEAFTNFTTKDGLASNATTTIYRASDGILWIGTDDKGVCGYDGKVFTSLDQQDGLAGNAVTSIVEDSDGSLWFGTHDGGLTHYQRSKTRPKVQIVSVTTDKTYRDLTAIPSLTIGSRVIFEYNAIDFKTLPEKRQYRLRIIDENNQASVDWRLTKADTFSYLFQTADTYTFEVVAIDRDLNYSHPAYVKLKVVPPWYLNGWIAIPLGGGILALLIWSIVSSVRVIHQRRQIAEQERQSREALEAKNQQISALNEQLQDENLRLAAELEITERIQQMILPSADELQAISELDIAGYMEPADDVGGDYYDVLQREGMVAISIGDVTGHGLESGLVMLMTQTAVQALLQSGETDPVHFLDTLNRTIYNNVQRMDSDKNLTLCLLDYQSGELKLSGQHEEMIVVRRDGKVELVDTIDLGFPIGLDDDIADFIDQTTVQLQPGDGVVLYTDGITEAEDTDDDQYGLERLCEVVSQHWAQSAEAIKKAVIAEVRKHIGEQEVYDDITLVVLKQK